MFDPATNLLRPAVAADFRALLEEIELSVAAPVVIRQQFDLARNAFVCFWFVYDFVTLAENQAYAVLEMAFREKSRLMTGQETNKRGLRALIREADKYGWLKRADFDESGLWMHPLDAPVSMRNDLAHGSDRLLPAGSHEMISFCAEIINHLFPLMAQNEPAPEACP